jgi:flagellar basal-body rod modification protein FlgD
MATVDGLGAGVYKGTFTDEVSTSAASKKATGGGSTLDKDAFLKLLVAQMKYQDPLEPTSNTEYISQFSTFTQLETMQNMSATLEMSRATQYVGQTVTIHTKMSTGEYREIEGVVDFVIFENGKALVSIDGALYPASEVYAVVNPEYKQAYDLAMAFAIALNSLPELNNLTLSDGELIDNLKDGYNAMNSYQQSFIAEALLEKLQEYVAWIAALRAAVDAFNNANNGDANGTNGEGAGDEGTGTGDDTGTDG